MELQTVLNNIGKVRVAVIGDFCLDVYWLADMTKSELSRETPHFPLPIVSERLQPGGAGNVVCNALALAPACVQALGVIGTDWRGAALKKSLSDAGADVTNLAECADCVTNAYIKPLRGGISDVVYEDPRLDFENYASLPQTAEDALLAALDALEADVLCVCDQMRHGCITPRVREKICTLPRRGITVICDSRDRVALYRNVWIKPNEVEAARALQAAPDSDPADMARALCRSTGCGAIITLGDRGCAVCRDGEAVHHVPAKSVAPPLDFCGAGDTFLSALACAAAAGAPWPQAAQIANTAAAVTIKKLNTTGTATRGEIAARWEME